MEAKQGLILVLCSMILAAEVACFPSDVRVKSFTQDDAAALEKYEDWNWKKILKKLPNFLFPIIRKILKGIANSEDPIDVLLSILGEEPKKKKKNKKNKKKNKKKKEEEEENNESENENKEEEPEPEPEENNKSEKPDKESQGDMNDKHQINGPEDW